MTPKQLHIGISTFPYGGNGSAASETPETRKWILRTVLQAVGDKRVSAIDTGEERFSFADGKIEITRLDSSMDFCDTPITMTRNASVVEALKRGIDVLVMVDSDMVPDIYMGQDPAATRFWDTAFDAIYAHWEKGPLCIGAPYMGGPPHENVFVFTWQNFQSDHPNRDFKLRQYTREEAYQFEGVHECAALPTGLIAFDTRLFKVLEPGPDLFAEQVRRWFGPADGRPLTQGLVDGFVKWVEAEKYRREQSWFYYEYSDRFQHQKGSTEDVTATRDMSCIGQIKLGYNPVRCAWSCWAAHIKPKFVGKPQPLTVEQMGSKLLRAAREGLDPEMKCVDLKLGG